MLALIIIVAVFIGVGMVFAVPAYLPALRRRARHSPEFRKGLIAVFSVITFVIIFLFTAYINALAVKTLSTPFYCNEFECIGTPYRFEDDTRRDVLFIRELWLMNMTPPVFISDTTCFTGDETVCDYIRELPVYMGSGYVTVQEYIQIILLVVLSVVSCGLMVRFITRERRKRKVAET